MGSDDRTAAGSLAAQLESEPYRFDFYQAVRLLEQLRPNAVPLGHGGSNREPVSLRAKIGFDFPASDLVSAAFPEDVAAPIRLTVAFMGLAGGSGPLPPPYTELILRRIAVRDFAARDFLDIFSHRLLSFLYRVRKKHRVGLNSRSPEDSDMARWLFDLAGLGEAARSKQDRKWARPLLRYTGILAVQTRSMAGLGALISDHFKVAVAGQHLLGRWLNLDARDHTRIGLRAGANRRVGIDAVLGARVWDQMGRIELRLGPLTLAGLGQFLPNGSAYAALNRIVRVYLRQDLDVNLRLLLAPGEVSGTRLSRTSRLGWTSWLNTGRSQAGDRPVSLRLPALEAGGALWTAHA